MRDKEEEEEEEEVSEMTIDDAASTDLITEASSIPPEEHLPTEPTEPTPPPPVSEEPVPPPSPPKTEEDIWLYLKEAVTSANPLSIEELKQRLLDTAEHIPQSYMEPVVVASIKRSQSMDLSTVESLPADDAPPKEGEAAPGETKEGEPKPAEGAAPPADGAVPPADGAVPPADGAAPPAEGAAPPAEGTAPPTEGAAPPAEGAAPPAEGTAPPTEGAAPPAEGTAPPTEGAAPPAEGAAPPAEAPPAEPAPAVDAAPVPVEGESLHEYSFNPIICVNETNTFTDSNSLYTDTSLTEKENTSQPESWVKLQVLVRTNPQRSKSLLLATSKAMQEAAKKRKKENLRKTYSQASTSASVSTNNTSDLWNFLKKVVSSSNPKNLEEFKQSLKEIAEHIPDSFLEPIVESSIKRTKKAVLPSNPEIASVVSLHNKTLISSDLGYETRTTVSSKNIEECDAASVVSLDGQTKVREWLDGNNNFSECEYEPRKGSMAVECSDSESRFSFDCDEAIGQPTTSKKSKHKLSKKHASFDEGILATEIDHSLHNSELIDKLQKLKKYSVSDYLDDRYDPNEGDTESIKSDYTKEKKLSHTLNALNKIKSVDLADSIMIKYLAGDTTGSTGNEKDVKRNALAKTLEHLKTAESVELADSILMKYLSGGIFEDSVLQKSREEKIAKTLKALKSASIDLTDSFMMKYLSGEINESRQINQEQRVKTFSKTLDALKSVESIDLADSIMMKYLSGTFDDNTTRDEKKRAESFTNTIETLKYAESVDVADSVLMKYVLKSDLDRNIPDHKKRQNFNYTLDVLRSVSSAEQADYIMIKYLSDGLIQNSECDENPKQETIKKTIRSLKTLKSIDLANTFMEKYFSGETNEDGQFSDRNKTENFAKTLKALESAPSVDLADCIIVKYLSGNYEDIENPNQAKKEERLLKTLEALKSAESIDLADTIIMKYLSGSNVNQDFDQETKIERFSKTLDALKSSETIDLADCIIVKYLSGGDINLVDHQKVKHERLHKTLEALKTVESVDLADTIIMKYLAGGSIDKEPDENVKTEMLSKTLKALKSAESVDLADTIMMKYLTGNIHDFENDQKLKAKQFSETLKTLDESVELVDNIMLQYITGGVFDGQDKNDLIKTENFNKTLESLKQSVQIADDIMNNHLSKEILETTNADKTFTKDLTVLNECVNIADDIIQEMLDNKSCKKDEITENASHDIKTNNFSENVGKTTFPTDLESQLKEYVSDASPKKSILKKVIHIKDKNLLSTIQELQSTESLDVADSLMIKYLANSIDINVHAKPNYKLQRQSKHSKLSETLRSLRSAESVEIADSVLMEYFAESKTDESQIVNKKRKLCETLECLRTAESVELVGSIMMQYLLDDTDDIDEENIQERQKESAISDKENIEVIDETVSNKSSASYYEAPKLTKIDEKKAYDINHNEMDDSSIDAPEWDFGSQEHADLETKSSFSNQADQLNDEVIIEEVESKIFSDEALGYNQSHHLEVATNEYVKQDLHGERSVDEPESHGEQLSDDYYAAINERKSSLNSELEGLESKTSTEISKSSGVDMENYETTPLGGSTDSSSLSTNGETFYSQSNNQNETLSKNFNYDCLDKKDSVLSHDNIHDKCVNSGYFSSEIIGDKETTALTDFGCEDAIQDLESSEGEEDLKLVTSISEEDDVSKIRPPMTRNTEDVDLNNNEIESKMKPLLEEEIVEVVSKEIIKELTKINEIRKNLSPTLDNEENRNDITTKDTTQLSSKNLPENISNSKLEVRGKDTLTQNIAYDKTNNNTQAKSNESDKTELEEIDTNELSQIESYDKRRFSIIPGDDAINNITLLLCLWAILNQWGLSLQF